MLESEFENMSYISKKKRSKNFVVPTVFLSGIGVVAPNLAVNSVSADTVTGWDTNGSNKANLSNAASTAASATASASSAASSKAASNTSAAPSATSSTSTGWVDVYVDHSKMDDAITNAAAQGVNIVHDSTAVVTGDASATAKNTSSAAAYYSSVAGAISSTAASYTAAMNNYNAAVTKNTADAANANANMEALRTNLAAQGQTVNMHSKQYSASAVASDTAVIQRHIADGKAYRDVKNAIANANAQQNAMTDFTVAANQGAIKLKHETVKIKTPADAQKYVDTLNTKLRECQTYMNNLKNQTGTIPDANKPTYTLYNFVVDPTVEAAGTAPVDVYNYTAVPVTKPTTPSVHYHYVDIRCQMTGTSGYDNADGNKIILDHNNNANGNVVAQAVVNQTVGIRTDNQPLPAHRFDKIENLTIITKLPNYVTFDAAKTNTDPTNWTVSYDAATGTVTQTATPFYLVQINRNQDANNAGTVGGTTNGEFTYRAPQVYFKLNKDDMTYQATSTTIVNGEYMFVGAGVQIRTDSANPTKVNENSMYQDIDGKAVLPGSINNYVLNWDFNQYKGVNIDTAMQNKGLKLIDDFPENAVSLTGPISIIDPTNGRVLFSSAIPNGVAVGSTGQFQGTDGKNVPGLTWKVIDKTNAPDNLKGKLDGEAIMVSYNGINGNFYKTYVQNGKSLNVVLPMTTKKITNTKKVTNTTVPDGTYNGNSYKNVAYQSDFGNDYKSNTVTNTAPKLNPKKDAVLSFAKLTSLDINNNKTAEIENGSWFDYRAKGSKLPTNLSEPIRSYVITDTMDSTADEYDGQFKVQNDSAIYFRAGSTLAQRYPHGLAAGTDISKYFTQTLQRNVTKSGNSAVGTVNNADASFSLISLSADADFLAQIDTEKTNIDFDVFFDTKRIADKDGVRNTFKEVINGVDYGSNTVTTNSSKNALDKLQDALNSLQSSAAAGIQSNAAGIHSNAVENAKNSSAVASMAGALSIVVRNLTSFQSETNSAVSSLSSATSQVASTATSYFDYTSHQISLVASTASSAASSIATSASSAIASNSTAMNSVASSATSAVSSAASSVNALIAALASKLSAATDQSISTMTIYDRTVTTDAEALTYAVNHGVAAGSIKSIRLNTAGKFVVSYNTSTTGINNSTEATVNTADNDTVAKSTIKINFYTLTSTEQVYTELAKLGYPKTNVVQVTKNNNVYTAIVNVPKMTVTSSSAGAIKVSATAKV